MCNRLNEVLASARTVVASLDTDSLSPSQVASGFKLFAELEKVAAAGKILLAPKVGQSDAWAKAGHRSPEEWMARKSGTSVGQAKNTVETGKRLSELPATEAAVKSGALSLAQAAAVSEAAAAAPDREAELLEIAGRESLKQLQKKSRRVVLDSRGSVEERYERQRRLRSFRSWTDDEGMTAGQFRLTPDAGAAVVNAIRREADRHYRQAKEGRKESSENYAADALVGLVTGQGRIGTKSGSRGSEIVVVVSHLSLKRGTTDPSAGELCEVPGFGAISVSRVKEMLPDAFLKAVVHDGTRITHVKHFGRHRPAEVDTALLAEAVISHGEVRCVVEGCGRTLDIQWDHRRPSARGGATSTDNLHPMCGRDNRDKEQGRVVQRGNRWVRVADAAREVAGERSPP